MKKTVLVCDDDEGIVDVARIVLEEKGYEVIPITQTEQIFSLIDKKNPSMILVDLWMPEMTGDEITRKIKSTPETRHIPVILFSASKETEDVAKQAGAEGYLCKPFDIAQLEEMVERCIGA